MSVPNIGDRSAVLKSILRDKEAQELYGDLPSDFKGLARAFLLVGYWKGRVHGIAEAKELLRPSERRSHDTETNH